MIRLVPNEQIVIKLRAPFLYYLRIVHLDTKPAMIVFLYIVTFL